MFKWCSGYNDFSTVSLENEGLIFPNNYTLLSTLSRRRQIKRQAPPVQPEISNTTLLRNFQVKEPPVVPRGGKICRKTLLRTTFANSAGKPARVSYAAPKDCGEAGSWASVVLSLTITSQGTQFDRLSSIFLNGVEIMRTSTAEPTLDGIIWTIEKDVTRYVSLLAMSEATLVMVLDNIIDKSINLDAQFNVQLSATYYAPTNDFTAPVSPSIIMPLLVKDSTTISVPNATAIPIQIPQNTVSAVVEIYASGSEKEEFWYLNSLDQVLAAIPDPSNGDGPGKGPFREIQLWIDETMAGVAFPYPVIFTGGIMLTWWRPIAAYGSLDQPTYTIDITPFLPLLTDSKPHNFTLIVAGQGENGSINSRWYLSGNIAINVDPSGVATTGKILNYKTTPNIKISGENCDGVIFTSVEASRKLSVESYLVTGGKNKKKVSFNQDLLYENKQNLAVDGNTQQLAQVSTGSSVSKTDSIVTFYDHFSYPLTVTLQNFKNELKGEISLNYNRRVKPLQPQGIATSIQTTQIATGTMVMQTKDRSAGGYGQNGQVFYYTDERGSVFGRDVLIRNVTEIIKDVTTGPSKN